MTDRAQFAGEPYSHATLPLHYRCVGWNDWIEGTAVNVSRTGLVFEGEQPIANGSAVEFWLEIPGDHARPATRVLCAGTVVRIEGASRFAVRFADFEFPAPREPHSA